MKLKNILLTSAAALTAAIITTSCSSTPPPPTQKNMEKDINSCRCKCMDENSRSCECRKDRPHGPPPPPPMKDGDEKAPFAGKPDMKKVIAEKMKAFDKDRDGKLSEIEKAEADKFIKEKKGRHPDMDAENNTENNQQ